MNFRLSSGTDKNKVFIVRRSELEGRFDPFFYRTDLREIDTIVRGKAEKFLGNFALTMDGGATPLKAGGDEYYADESVGIPLLRVQNITEEGINFDNLVFINKQTHENYLSRSRVFGGDLLVTITGRIASSAVAPEGFEGNINQHSVVIRTRNQRISEYLAVFLNSHVGQKLAIKRTTGGTRPALDYKALIKIPVVEGLPIVETMRKAYLAKKEKEEQSQKLLDGIDDYLLGELGIDFPEREENTLKSRIFIRRLSEVSGGRLDAFFSSLSQHGQSGTYKFYKLKEIANIRKGDTITRDGVVKGTIPVIAGGQTSPYTHNVANCKGDVITVSASGSAGYVWYHSRPIFASDCTIISSANTNNLNNKFLFECLKSQQQNIYNLQQGSNQPHVYPSDLGNIKIPLPPLKKQNKVANHIAQIRNQAEKLQQEAKANLEQAKQEVEAIILGIV